MDTEFKERQQRNYSSMRMIYDLTMAILILGMAAVMFFGDKWKIPQIEATDAMFRYLFGGICLLYGGFRRYRGIKRDY